MNMGEYIKNLRRAAGMTQEELGAMLNPPVQKSGIAKWENGRVEKIRRDHIAQMAAIFDVSPVRLMCLDEEIPGFYDTDTIPILGTVAAGVPIYAEENYVGEISVGIKNKGDLFALRIKGDSMSPRIMDGDTVIVRKADDIESGEIGIVIVNGDEATCKKIVKYSDAIMLVPLNTAYEAKVYGKEDIENLPVRIIGKVIKNIQTF